MVAGFLGVLTEPPPFPPPDRTVDGRVEPPPLFPPPLRTAAFAFHPAAAGFELPFGPALRSAVLGAALDDLAEAEAGLRFEATLVIWRSLWV